MKNLTKALVVSTTIGLAGTFAITGCKKEQPTIASHSQSQTPASNSPQSVARTVSFEGVNYHLLDNAGNPLPDGYDVNQPESICFAKQQDSFNVVVRYFNNETEFKDFIRTQPDDSAEVLGRLRKKDLVMSYPNIDQEIANTDADPNAEPSKEFQDWFDAHVRKGNLKVTGTGVIYEHDCFYGNNYGLSPYPNWSFGSFRNKASSLNFAGLSGLYDGKWWRGRGVWFFQLYLGGPCTPDYRPPFFSFYHTVDFDNRAESSL